MTNQNNHPNNDMKAVRGLGQLPNASTKLPTLTNQNNELDEILAKAMAHYKAEDWNGSRILTEAKQAIQAHTNAEIAKLLNAIDEANYAESCVPDCDEVRHARHEGEWTVYSRVDEVIQAERALIEKRMM